MKNGTNITQEQRLSLRLSQSQLRYVRLLEMSAPEVDNAVAKELDENPALDKEENSEQKEETPRYFYSALPTSPSYDFYAPADDSQNLYDVLSAQIDQRQLSERDARLAHYVIGSLDSNGYLTRTPQSLADDYFFSEGEDVNADDMTHAIEIVQSLDPAGIAAADLRQSLLIQIKRLSPSATRDDALKIIESQFEAFVMRHSHKIVSALKMPQNRIQDAYNLIRTLNPKPGAALNADASASSAIIPDFIVNVVDGELEIKLNNILPELTIEKSFSDAVSMMQQRAEKRSDGYEFIVARYNDAREFIKILKRRQETLFTVMTAIVNIQRDYFLNEDESYLRPMGLKEISAATGLDISVVSRATNNKYVVLSHGGILPLRFFFSEAFGEGENESSGREIETAIKKLIEQEDKQRPLSDDAICNSLREMGYPVSRRTVNKYRDRLGIPVARLRKQI